MKGLGQTLVDEEAEKILTYLINAGKITKEDAEEAFRYLHEDSSASINED